MHFGIVISFAILTIGSESSPQFRSSISLGGFLDGARNQVRNSFFQFGNPLHRNENSNRRNGFFHNFFDDQTVTRQTHRPNNFEQQQQQQQISQSDEQLWNQCLNLFANPPRNLANQNSIHTVSVPSNREEHYSSNPTERRGPPQPGFHHPGPMPDHNQRPGPQSQHHQSQNGVEPGFNVCQEPAVNVSPKSSTDEILPSSSTTTTTTTTTAKTIVEENASSEGSTKNAAQNPVTTEFDWNNYYPEGASINNPGGAGMLDVRGDFQ